MSQKTNRYLKYGDTIMLYSNEEPKTYLSARSLLERSVYYLQIPDGELLSINAYENSAELVFSLYPKLYYEASKNYMKFHDADNRKKTMLKKRMEAEKEINQKRIERFLNENITIGSEIQLFHVFSKSYVKATREKNSRSNQLFNLSLAKQLSSGMHFKIKINPYYSFKKDGEKISYEDQFYFESVKLESRLVYKEVPLCTSLVNNNIFKNKIKKPPSANEKIPNNSPKKLKRQDVVQEELKLEYFGVMETQNSFKQYEAGHRKDDINNFKALFLASAETKEKEAMNNSLTGIKNIHWGDFIRLKHVRRLDKKQGAIYSEHIVTGQSPKAYFYTQENNPHNIIEKDAASSIFQIMTIDEELMGKPLEIDSETFSFPIMLRHYLTGRYLKINTNTCLLSENIDDVIINDPKLSSLVTKNVGFRPARKATVFSLIKDPHSPLFKARGGTSNKQGSFIHLVDNKDVSNSFTNNSPNNIILNTNNNNTNANNDDKADENLGNSPFEDVLQHKIMEFFFSAQIIMTVASKDFGLLNTSHCFSLMGKNTERFISVNEEEVVNEGRYTLLSEENQAIESKNFLSSDCFQRTFFNMNPLDRKNFELKAVEASEADFFFFSSVSNEEIADIMAISSKAYPLISLSSDFLFSNRSEVLGLANSSLEKICLWICESKEKRVGQIKTQPLANRQKLIREMGVIDMIVKILFELYDRRLLQTNIFKGNLDIFALAEGIIQILQLTNKENYQNAIYIFQWYSLFKMIITDDSTSNELEIDDLLIRLFHETKLNVSYRGDLERLTPSINFENCNRSALNLVIAFCTFNEFLQKDDVEEIISTVLENENNRGQIFRPFILKSKERDLAKKIVLKVSKEQEIEVNERNFILKQKIFLYVSKLLVLAIELSKGNPSLVVSLFEELYPFEVCLEVLKIKRINCEFKSLFVNLFVESYLAYDFRYSSIQKFPNNIRFRGHVFSHNQVDAKIKQHNLNLIVKYFNESVPFRPSYFNENNNNNNVFNENLIEKQEEGAMTLNLKHIIKDFLQNPEFLNKPQAQVTTEDHHLINSMLNFCEFVLVRGFYASMSEADDLRFSLQTFLKMSYAFITLIIEKKIGNIAEKKHRDTLLLDINVEEVGKKTFFATKNQEDVSAAAPWVNHIINCLIFIEKKSQDSFLSDFFGDSKTMKLFDTPIYRDKREKQEKIKEFLYTLQYPDTMDVYYYIELLLLNNVTISQCVVELLHLTFSLRKNFLININQTLLIEESLSTLYQNLTNIFYKLHYTIVEIQYNKSYDTQRNDQLLCELDTHLKALLHGVLSTSNPESDFVYNINEEFSFNIKESEKKQGLLRELGVHLELLQVIQFINKNTSFKDKALEIKNEILKKSLLVLIFFNLKNEENQTAIREYPKFEDSLLEILLRDNKSLQKLVFRVFAEIYRDNYPVLLNLDKMCHDLTSKLGKKFSLNYETKKNKEYCVYFLLLLTFFFKIKNKILTQNQTFLIKEITKSIPDFFKTIEKAVSQASNLTISLENEQESVEVPEDILLSTIFFNVFTQIAEKANNYVLNYCKIFLSIRQIGDLLSKLDNWFMLKLEILGFLNQIYVKNKKLEDNESSELQYFVKDTLLSQLNEYIHEIKRLDSMPSAIFHCNLVNIFENKVFLPYSNENLLIHINYFSAYQQYVFEGIFETFANYLEKIPKKPNEIDLQILELYTNAFFELSKGLCVEINAKKELEKQKDNAFSKEIRTKESIKKGLFERKTVNFDDLPGVKPGVSFLEAQEHKNLLENGGGFEKIENLSQVEVLASGILEENNKKVPQKMKEELKNMMSKLTTNHKLGAASGHRFNKARATTKIMFLEEELDRIQNKTREKLFDEASIEEEHSLELDYLVSFLIEIKVHETKDPTKFKRIVESLINVVGSECSHIKTKLKAVKIIRKLSNFKQDMRVNEEIQKELVDIELMNFLCKVTAEEDNALIKYEYILGLVDFMDEVNENIQKSFYFYLEKDEDNKFLSKLRDFIYENFSDFKDYEKSLQHHSDSLGSFSMVSSQFSKIIQQKIHACTAAFELLRLGCENHYSDMQNFLREQVHNGKIHQKSINMIAFAADLLEKYSKMITERNIELGEKLLDFLIETLQGPCNENQLVLCNNTKILENLEDIMLDLQVQKVNDRISGFTNKMIILMLALFEGNKDTFLLNKIVTYVSPELMYDRINQIYRTFYRLAKKNAYKEIQKTAQNNKPLIKKAFSYKNPFKNINFKRIKTGESSPSTKLPHNTLDILLLKEETQGDSIIKTKEKEQFSQEKVENSISEGFNIYILMKLLSSVYPKLKEKISSWKQMKLFQGNGNDKETELLWKAIRYYRSNVVMIEIINNHKDIQRVFFRLPVFTKFLSKSTVESFTSNVNRESIDEKINGLLNNSAKFLEEMQHFMYLRAKGLRLGIGALSFVRDIGLIVSTIISFIILMSSEGNQSVLSFFRVVQLVIAVIVLILWCIFTLPLDLKSARREYLQNIERKDLKSEIGGVFYKEIAKKFMGPIFFYLVILKSMIFSSRLLYFTLNILWATLGLTISPIFNTILLLDIIDRSLILQNVIKSITINWPQLVMTGILGLIVMFIYSMIGYYGSGDFRENMIYMDQLGPQNDETLYLCDSPMHCFMFVVNIGLRSGGGVGDTVKQVIPSNDSGLYNMRFFFDLTFFLMMNVILLNIIFGIIIDTFAELRVQKNIRDFDQKNNCFICGTERSTFEKVGVSFNKHIKKEHNLWNYLFYVIHLTLKDPKDYNGTESYVATKLKQNDISWFPIGKALSLLLKGETVGNTNNSSNSNNNAMEETSKKNTGNKTAFK